MTFIERHWRALLVALALAVVVLQVRTIHLLQAIDGDVMAAVVSVETAASNRRRAQQVENPSGDAFSRYEKVEEPWRPAERPANDSMARR